jgi:hypothetical protein
MSVRTVVFWSTTSTPASMIGSPETLSVTVPAMVPRSAPGGVGTTPCASAAVHVATASVTLAHTATTRRGIRPPIGRGLLHSDEALRARCSSMKPR